MPGLTVTEKEHWKDRIGKRIDKQIERITATQPTILEAVKREAKQRALVALGLNEAQTELDQIVAAEKNLDKRKKQLQRVLYAKVRCISVEDVEEEAWYRMETEVNAAKQRREALLEEELLAAHEVGRRILALKNERENLLDTVWLSTSSAQLKTLWAKDAELLGDEQTPLQREALAIAPVEE